MEEKKVAVVTNPNAGKNTPRAGLGKVIASILATPHWTYNPETLSALADSAKELSRDRPDILVIAGGDGSVHQTLSKVLLEHERSPGTPLPQILIIPIGTILQKYYEDRKHRGRMRAIKVILATLGNEIASLVTFRKSKQILTRQVHATITLPDGNEPPVAPFMTHTGILCAAIDQIGFGCRAMPEARSRPGCFMLRSTHLSFWRLTLSLGALWSGRPLPATFDAVVPHLTIDYQEPTIATVDGDMKPPRTSDIITCGPSISFITS